MNNIEYFQHLVDTTEEPTMKWMLMEQLQKEQRRVAKKRLADRLAREEAEKAAEQEPTPTVEESPKRGRKPKTQEE